LTRQNSKPDVLALAIFDFYAFAKYAVFLQMRQHFFCKPKQTLIPRIQAHEYPRHACPDERNNRREPRLLMPYYRIHNSRCKEAEYDQHEIEHFYALISMVGEPFPRVVELKLARL
jgi:hypothetical protein